MRAPLLEKSRSPIGYPQGWLDNLRRLDRDLDLMWSLGRPPQVEPHWVVVQRQYHGTGYRELLHLLGDNDECREPTSRDLLCVASMDSWNNSHVVDEFNRRFDEAIDGDSNEHGEDIVDDLLHEHRRAVDKAEAQLYAALK